MEFCVFVEPQQGTTYEEVVTLAQTAEQLGFDGFFTSDHYYKIGDGEGLPGPLDAWTTLAGLARETNTLQLGTLVSPITFRRPGPMAISVAQVDHMSGGRIELGLGTGWHEPEHSSYGLDFPRLAERFDLLEEGLEIITGLWRTPAGENFSYKGSTITITHSPALPKPVQPAGPPIIIGGRGKVKTPRLAALFADEFNVGFTDPSEFEIRTARVKGACEAYGRDPDGIKLSIALATCCGLSGDDLDRRAAAAVPSLDVMKSSGLYGSPSELIARIKRYAAAGADRMYLQVWDIADIAHVELLATEVVATFR